MNRTSKEKEESPPVLGTGLKRYFRRYFPDVAKSLLIRRILPKIKSHFGPNATVQQSLIPSPYHLLNIN